MPKTTTAQGQIMVCEDCYFAAVNGEINPTANPAPWALDPSLDVTPGVLEHGFDCALTGGDEDCNCEEPGFSWTPCQGCGSTLGGDRHPMVWWA